VYTLASAGCSVSPDAGWLIACRAFQGAGGAALTPMSMGIITATFADPAARARVLGIWSGTFGVGMAIGPALGLPVAAGTAVVGPLVGRVLARHGPRRCTTAAGAALGTSCLALAEAPPHASWAFLVAAYVVFGAGYGTVNTIIAAAAILRQRPAPRPASPAASPPRAASRAVTRRVRDRRDLRRRAARHRQRRFPAASHPAWLAIAAAGSIVLPLSRLVGRPAQEGREQPAHASGERPVVRSGK
jgi:MFS family permease